MTAHQDTDTDKILPRIPVHMCTKRWIDSEIKYESSLGVHTYHTCKYCNRNSTRAIMCVDCWRRAREELSNSS